MRKRNPFLELFQLFLIVFLVFCCGLSPKAFAGFERFDNNMRAAVGSQQGIPDVQIVTAPAAASTTAVLSATNNPSTSATVTVTTGITNPDVARNLTATTSGTTADCAAGNVAVTGKDILGRTITDNIWIKNALNGTGVGTKAFKSVSSIVLPAEQSTHSCNFAVGYGASLGLNRCLDGKGYVFNVVFGGTREATFPTMYTNTSAVSGNMAAPNSTPDAASNIAFMFFHNYRCVP